MRFMMVGTQIVYKLLVYIKFFFAGYKVGRMEASLLERVKKYLAEEQKTTVRECIDRLDKINICACPKMIMRATNYIIYSFENCIVMIKVILNAKSQVSYTKTKTPSSRTKARL